MSELTLSDFKVGQKVGCLWRHKEEDKVCFSFKKAKISKLSTTSKGTTVYLKPQLFQYNYKIEDEEFEDYRQIPDNGLIMISTPMLLSDETEKYFEDLAEMWNVTPPKSVFE